MSINSRIKVIHIISQRNAFFWQRFPESHFARKENLDIDIVTICCSRNKKIVHLIRITRGPLARIRKRYKVFHTSVSLTFLEHSSTLNFSWLCWVFLLEMCYSFFQILFLMVVICHKVIVIAGSCLDSIPFNQSYIFKKSLLVLKCRN